MRLTEVALAQADFGNMVSNSFSVIKEPVGSYFIGLPFNKAGLSFDSLLSFLLDSGFIISKETTSILRDLDSAQMVTFSLDSNTLEPLNVNYLYSIPGPIGGGTIYGETDSDSSGD